jgi:Fe-S cluster assembly protein SufD
MNAALGRSANFSSLSISLGGALVRNDVGVVLSEGTEATLNGLYIANGTQHVDNHTVIDHAKPHGTSHELYKGILDGRAGAVFNGRIIVRKDAQKTDSKQTNKNLVLSDEAVIDTKPELQILADDVRCTHGATIGQLDAESMFYLQSRGIGREDARNLLIYAFAQDIADRIKVEALHNSLERILFEKFHEHSH